MKPDSENPNFKLINLILSAMLGAVLFVLLGPRLFLLTGDASWPYGVLAVTGAIVGAVGHTLYGDEIWEWIQKIFPW